MKLEKLILIAVLCMIGKGLWALPPTETITEMPFTMGLNDVNKFIDLNGDGVYEHYTYTNSGLGFNSTISMSSNLSIGGFAYEVYSADDLKQNGTEYIGKILDKGDEIGPNLNYRSSAYIAGWNVDGDVKGDTFMDGKREGYLACRIPVNVPSDLKQGVEVDYQYAWVHILINDPQQTVTFLSSGFEEDLNTPIAAGDSPVVPIPLLASILGFGLIGMAAMKKRMR